MVKYCAKCGSENLSVERRIDGFVICIDCGNKHKNVTQSGYIVTDCHHERADKRCLCCVCGKINKCTPMFDFYTTDDHGDGLVCESCFHEYVGHRLKQANNG